jgi:hypothetical protein
MIEQEVQVKLCTVKTYTRIPRKKKKSIPVGLYCYEQTSGFKDLGEGKWGITIKECNFYSRIKVKDITEESRPHWMDQEYVDEFKDNTLGWCKLIKGSIDDQCKSCGLKYGKLN